MGRHNRERLRDDQGRPRSGGRRRRRGRFWLWLTVYGPEPAEEPLPGTVKGMGIEVGIKARLPSGIVPRCRPERLREPLCDLSSTRAATARCRLHHHDAEEQLGQPIVSHGLPLTSCLRSQRLCRRCDIPRLPGRRLTGWLLPSRNEPMQTRRRLVFDRPSHPRRRSRLQRAARDQFGFSIGRRWSRRLLFRSVQVPEALDQPRRVKAFARFVRSLLNGTEGRSS